ncbi:TPA: hypothetical protein ACGF6W_003271 [Vibrio cholerae]
MKKQTNHKRFVKPYSQLTFMQKFRAFIRDSQVFPCEMVERMYSSNDRALFERYVSAIHFAPYTVHTRINFRSVATQQPDWNVKHLRLEKMWQMWVVGKTVQHKGHLNEKTYSKAS